MTTYNPTPHLRYVNRHVAVTPGIVQATRVLQVGYRPINGGEIEWQDVPCVEEPSDDEKEEGGWTGRPCPACRGHGLDKDSLACRACGGTGDEYSSVSERGSDDRS